MILRVSEGHGDCDMAESYITDSMMDVFLYESEQMLEQLENIAHDFPGVESCFALQAGREVRVVVVPEKVSEGEAQMLAKEICERIEKEMTYPGQIKVTIIRETRSVEYAK